MVLQNTGPLMKPAASIAAGYELTNWFNMVNGLSVADVSTEQAVRRRGSLTLEAVTVKLGFAF